MISDDELAQGIVECGVGYRIDLESPHSGTAWCLYEDEIAFLTAESFVRDPRVAMAAMEKCDYIEISHGNSGWSVSTWNRSQWISVDNESLELAINTACYEALKHG